MHPQTRYDARGECVRPAPRQSFFRGAEGADRKPRCEEQGGDEPHVHRCSHAHGTKATDG
jgi:hypothetical protein